MRRRLDDRARAAIRVARLEDAGAHEHPVGAELHAERRVGGRRDASRGEGHDGEPTVLRDPADELVRGAVILGDRVELFLAHTGEPADGPEHGAHVSDGVDDVAGAGLALRPDHRRAFGDPAEGLAEIRRAADEGNGERMLVDVVLDVGRGQDLGLVDVVDLQRLEDLRLDEVADPALRHHGDRDGLLDLADLLGIRHPGDPAVTADVGRDALEGHDRTRAGILGDTGLLGVDDVHDDAALEHLREARLDAQRADLGHARSVARAARGEPRAAARVIG